ncbi:MAG: alanine--tRNA ligase [Deltaproteobacteria bacterium]|jgi:alanyl-tRNA synthetase|nr:alanine--tRNA ligase [Deltaproteobacteria bacterium]
MDSSNIRKTFTDFFADRGHRRVPSSSLVPQDDPTLLFTNAGMVQFKRIFTGEEKRDYNRAVTFQKCVRAGGKHNDLENVGYTARHHTFFEMLGNFSFGDYFKALAIEYAWELLTVKYNLPKDKLYATVYTDDDEAYSLWGKIAGLPSERIIRLGEKDNFWAMGDTGPCGPCSEILIDQGEHLGCNRPDCGPGCDCDRYLEIWNLVFMQFERDQSGQSKLLPKPSIDTGMGLERLTAVLSGVYSNFETDIFRPLLDKISELSKHPYLYGTTLHPEDAAFQTNVSLRVIADHARAVTFLIGDGVRPENLGRGYVLRRILRRAVRHGRKLGLTQPFLAEMVGSVIETLGEAFPELVDNAIYISKVVHGEEERFIETLGSGLGLLTEAIEDIKKKNGSTIPGSLTFKLYDTYGFPVDLVADVARENNLSVDEAGFNEAMEEQKAKGRAAWKSGGLKNDQVIEAINQLSAQGLYQKFIGYQQLALTEASPYLLFKGDQKANLAQAGEEVCLVFPETPFYATSGGQEGDGGLITFPSGTVTVSEVSKAPGSGFFIHHGVVEKGHIEIDQPAELTVNQEKRTATAANHPATHLLHRALRLTLGEHVRQAGSMVAHDRLRFDFTHDQAVSLKELDQIELLVNADICADFEVKTDLMNMDQAVRSGAMALFEERYGEEVRVVSMGQSRELCGGTHAHSTGQLGTFLITSETAVSAGVRRLECLTGREAVLEIQNQREQSREVCQFLKSKPSELLDRVKKLQAKIKELEKGSTNQAFSFNPSELAKKAVKKNNVTFLAAQVQADNPKSLREIGDAVRDILGPKAVLALAAEGSDNKALLLVIVGKDQLNNFKAGDLIAKIAPAVGGRGGGKAELAQAGGPDVSGLDQALKLAENLVLGS